MNELLQTLLFSALKNLFEHQPTLSLFTSATNEREPNLSFHFANELWPYLFWLDCDFDVTKPDFERKRPDIIFHRRGTHRLNTLVVEVKRESNRDGLEGDFSKIRNEWFQGPLSYCFGATVLIDEKARAFSVSMLSNNENSEPCSFTSRQPLKRRLPPDRASPKSMAVCEMIRGVAEEQGETSEPPLCEAACAPLKAVYWG